MHTTQIKELTMSENGLRGENPIVEIAAVCHIIRNSAGQIYFLGIDGEYFDMSKYLGETLYLVRETK